MNNLNKHAKQTCEPSWYRKKGTHKLTTCMNDQTKGGITFEVRENGSLWDPKN